VQIYRRSEVVMNEEESPGRGNEEKDLRWWAKGHGLTERMERLFLGGGSEAMNLSIRFEDRNKDVPVHDIVALLKFVILTILVKSTLARNYSVLLEGWSLSTDLVPILPSAKVIRLFTECPPKTGKLTRNLE